MTEVLLIRHAESDENARKSTAKAKIDGPAFGNRNSPLTKRGIEQILGLGGLVQELKKVGINPLEYEQTVLCSLYRRTIETASTAGFRHFYGNSIVDESEIYGTGTLAGVDIVGKHVSEGGWIPEEEIERAKSYIDAVRNGTLPQRIVVTHGMVIAGIQTVLSMEGAPIPFDTERGFVPLQASITPVNI